MNFNKEYFRLRALGWEAKHAFSCAKINVAWNKLEDKGLVRFRTEPEDDMSLDDVIGEGANDKTRKLIAARVERDGVWGIIGEFKNESGYWEQGSSVWGFIGDDWKDSWSDTDVKAETMEALLLLKTKQELAYTTMRGVEF